MTEADRENNAVGILQKVDLSFKTASKSAGELKDLIRATKRVTTRGFETRVS